MKLYLKPEENVELYGIIDEYNNTMTKWNKVNKLIHAFPIPVVWSLKKKRALEAIGRNVAELQGEWLKHNGRANKFAENPDLHIPDDTDRQLVFMHVHSLLLNRINQFRQDFILLTANYNNKHAELQSQRNLNIALGSVLLSLVTSLLSLGLAGL